MAANNNIFKRGGAPQPPGGSGGPGYSIRSNAQASVGFAGGGPSSPILATNAGNGRPAPTLNYVKVTLEGEAGSLRRGEFQVTCFTPGEFDSVISKGGIGGIGGEVTISISRSGPGAGSGMSHTFKVYKNSFSTTKEGKYIVTVSAVGKGMELLKRDATTMGAVGKGKFFYKNISVLGMIPWFEKLEVSGLMDYFLWYVTNATVKMFPFAPEPNACMPGKFFTLAAPTGFTGPAMSPGFGSGIGVRNRLAYINLKWIIDTINGQITGPNKFQLIATTNMTVDDKGTPLLSGDPAQVILPRGDGYSDYSEGTVTMTDLIFSLLGTPSKIGTSFLSPTPAPMAGKQADCGLIYISYDSLRAIETNLTGRGEGGKEISDSAKHDASRTKMDLEGFLGSIFSVIREATGGFVDLVISEDPEAFDGGTLDSDLLIINKKCVQDQADDDPGYDDVSGEGGVRSATFTGDVPQGWQAEAFAGKNIGGDDKSGEKKSGPTPVEMIDDAMKALPKAGYDASQAAGIKAALRQAQDETPVESLGAIQNRPYPIGLSLKVNGVAGIGFGHCISMASLNGTKWGGNTVFTVTRVTHMVQNQDWTTDIESVARLK
jgi:hypothetical protein